MVVTSSCSQLVSGSNTHCNRILRTLSRMHADRRLQTLDSTGRRNKLAEPFSRRFVV
jgi:hypothetical protein